MNSPKKKSPAARGVPQPFNPRSISTAQVNLAPAPATLKPGGSSKSARRPVAPPAARPQTKLEHVQAKLAVPSQLKNRNPIAPQVYKPHPHQRVLQTKQAISQELGQVQKEPRGVAQASGIIHGSARKLGHTQKASLLLKGQAGIQLSKGASGGKGGFGYTSGALTYGKAEVEKAQQDLGLTGVKGHNKGKAGSGESSQTKNENKMLFEQLRANKQKDKQDKKKCLQYHKNDKNIGKKCPTCGYFVD
jgi:hypothetical protein